VVENNLCVSVFAEVALVIYQHDMNRTNGRIKPIHLTATIATDIT